MKTLLIKNSIIYDGSGAPPISASVLISAGRIVSIGEKIPNSNIEIDATGMVLTPGFIDVHGHSDISIIAAPEATSKIAQGITTEISGNCGLSPFPVNKLNREHLDQLYENYNCPIKWSDFDGYCRAIESRRPALNMVPLCGHNTLRAAVNGYGNGKLSSKQLAEAIKLLQTQLEQGAAGFSSGLLYTPGCFSDGAELNALLTTLAPFGRPYATHLRSEGNQLIEAIEEVINSCITADQPHLHISHLKTSGKENWGKLDSVLQLICNAPLRITADRYPYTESMTQLSIILPDHLSSMPNEELSDYLQSEVNANAVKDELRKYPAERWQTCRLVSTSSPRFKTMHGKFLAEFNDPAAVCVDIWRTDRSGAMAAFSAMSPDNLKRILQLDFVACGSDESARPLDHCFGVSHPRGFGSFPKFFRLLNGVLPLEDIVRRVTSLPASIFNLTGRGMIKPGYQADLVLLDLSEYHPNADFSVPHRLASGVKLVLVNGIPAYGEASLAPIARAGKILKPKLKEIL